MTGVHHAVTVPGTTANLGPGFDAFGLALAGGPPGSGHELSMRVRSVPRDAQDERVVTEIGCEASGEVPTGDDNLVWRSLVAFCDHHAVPVPDVAVRAHSTIPLERGLGSSSGAIVAGLVLGRALTGVVVGDRDLVVLASAIEGHPDNVGPALLGGLVACGTGDEGDLVVRRVNPAPSLRPVAFVPTTRQATTAARAVLPDTLSRAGAADQAARAGHVLAALGGVWPVDVRLAGDHLHEPARADAMPASAALLADLRAAGVHAWLSGAGPSVAAVVSRTSPRPDEVAALADDHGFAVHPLAVDLAGAVACSDDGCGVAGGRCVRCPPARV